MRKILVISVISLISLISLIGAKSVSAAVRCEIQYGGREVCVTIGQLQVNKLVCKPVEVEEKGGKQIRCEFVDNLGLNDHKFGPGEEVTFKIKVKNVGDRTLTDVNVMDTLPNLLTTGNGNPFFQIKELKPGEEQEREIKAKVVSADRFPANVLCVVNAVEAVSGDQKDRDTAQLCLEKKVPVAKELPPTGPEHWFMLAVGSLLSLTAGIKLVRLSKKYE